jgi:hypothetical protein
LKELRRKKEEMIEERAMSRPEELAGFVSVWVLWRLWRLKEALFLLYYQPNYHWIERPIIRKLFDGIHFS